MAVWLEVIDVDKLVVPQLVVDVETLIDMVGEIVDVAETHAVLVLDTDTVDVAETHAVLVLDTDTVDDDE